MKSFIAVVCLVACVSAGEIRDKRWAEGLRTVADHNAYASSITAPAASYSAPASYAEAPAISYTAPAARLVTVNKVVNVNKVVTVPQVIQVRKVVSVPQVVTVNKLVPIANGW